MAILEHEVEDDRATREKELESLVTGELNCQVYFYMREK